jgi:hypothetical protein
MAEVHGPGHVSVPRAHDAACEWLSNDPVMLDMLTGGPLAVAGEMPVVCSEGYNQPAGLDLLALAGIAVPPNRFHFRAGEAMAALAEAARDPAVKLVLQHVYPGDSWPSERCWIEPALLAWLNNKASLPALVDPDNTPERRVVDRADYLGGRPKLPVVVKVVTNHSNGGGRGVVVCRTDADLDRARQIFGETDQVIVEEMIEIIDNPCLNFAIMPDGEVRYLGFAGQEVSAQGEHLGNWIEAGASLPQSAVAAAAVPVRKAAARGYYGLAGVDIAFARDGRLYVLDLNFRSNASTSPVLFAPAIAQRGRGATMHLRRLQGAIGAAELAKLLTPFVRSGRIVPLSLFDAEAAGYADRPASARVLVVGAGRADVLATEAELASVGIA